MKKYKALLWSANYIYYCVMNVCVVCLGILEEAGAIPSAVFLFVICCYFFIELVYIQFPTLMIGENGICMKWLFFRTRTLPRKPVYTAYLYMFSHKFIVFSSEPVSLYRHKVLWAWFIRKNIIYPMVYQVIHDFPELQPSH